MQELLGITFTQLVLYYCIGLLGMIMSMLVQQVHHAAPIKEAGGFKWAVWILDNWKRTVLNLLAILVGVLFSEQLLGIELSLWSAFLAGWVTDDTIDALVNRKKAG